MIFKIFISWSIIFLFLIYPIDKISDYIVKKQINQGVRGVYLSKENFSYLKYINDLHHVRDIVQWTDFTNELNKNNNLLFSRIDKNSNFINNKKTILINGDSWAEMTYWKKAPNKVLKEYSINNDIDIVAAGISSFSVSPMSIQLKILRRDFNINPNIIISFFDYTDFGDELCRYKSKLLFENKKLISINPETYESVEVYSDLLLLWNKYKIFYDEELYGSQKLVYYAIERIKYFLTKKNTSMRCGWTKIANPLIEGLKNSEKIYIENVVTNYFNEVFKDIDIEKLYIIIHPHRNHYFNDQAIDKYKVYWAPIINKVIKKKYNNKINIIDFGSLYPKIYTDQNIKIKDIFIDGDISSHLNEDAHAIMIKKVLSIINLDN